MSDGLFFNKASFDQSVRQNAFCESHDGRDRAMVQQPTQSEISYLMRGPVVYGSMN